MNELVTLFDGNPVTTTLVLADGTGTQHKNVLSLVRKYTEDLEEFGGVAFVTRPFETNGGTQYQEVAYLNEPQATLLMTYMSNTPVIRQFKKALVAAFFELAAGRSLSIQSTPNNQISTKVSVNTAEMIREANKGNKFAQRFLQHVFGMRVDDIAAEIEHKQVVEDFKRAELAANYLDLLIEAQAEQWGIVRGLSDDGLQYLQGLPTQLFNAFRSLGKDHGLPMLAKGVESFGAILAKEAAGLEFYGWRRSIAKRVNGSRHFRFERMLNN